MGWCEPPTVLCRGSTQWSIAAGSDVKTAAVSATHPPPISAVHPYRHTTAALLAGRHRASLTARRLEPSSASVHRQDCLCGRNDCSRVAQPVAAASRVTSYGFGLGDADTWLYERLFLLGFTSAYAEGVATLAGSLDEVTLPAIRAFGSGATTKSGDTTANPDAGTSTLVTDAKAQQALYDFTSSWQNIIQTFAEEYHALIGVNVICCIVAAFLLPDVANANADPVANVLGFLALMTSLSGIWTSCLFSFTVNSRNTLMIAGNLEPVLRWTAGAACRVKTKGFGTATLFALPAASTAWSLAFLFVFLVVRAVKQYAPCAGYSEVTFVTRSAEARSLEQFPLTYQIIVTALSALIGAHTVIGSYAFVFLGRRTAVREDGDDAEQGRVIALLARVMAQLAH